MKAVQDMELVQVAWVDSSSMDAWVDKDGARAFSEELASRCQSVGYLYANSCADHIILAQTAERDNQHSEHPDHYHGLLKIPRRSIVHIHNITTGAAAGDPPSKEKPCNAKSKA